MSLGRFQILLVKIFITDFSEPKKADKVGNNMDNDWIYHVYRNRGKGSITLGVMSLDRFSFSNFVLLKHFHNKFLRT